MEENMSIMLIHKMFFVVVERFLQIITEEFLDVP